MRFNGLLSGVFAAALLATAGPALAQSTAPDLDVAGLKLGMTTDQAQAALAQSDPGIKLIPLYATDDPKELDSWNVPNGMGGDNGLAAVGGLPGSPSLKDAKVKVQIGLFAAAIQRVFDNSGQVITDPADRIESFEGDLFYLRFTPTDAGGRLYGISRFVAYPALGSIPSDAPSQAQLESQIEAKYGSSSTNALTGPSLWLYDTRGRLVSNRSSEFDRCRVSDADREAITGIGNLMLSTAGNIDYASPDLKTLQLVLDDGGDGTTLSTDDQINVSAVLASLVSSVNVATGASDPLRYRKCGVELQTFVRTGGDRVIGVSEELEDVNALYYDNGIKAYLQAKYLPQAAAPAASPTL